MLESLVDYGYIGLFLASFLSATFLPLSSEVVLLALISAGLDLWTCIFVATFGNWLGGMTCYYLGNLGNVAWIEKYLKVKREKIEKLQKWLQGKGAVMAFFSFLPGIGDVIIIALGFMRANIFITSTSMLAGKFLRYIVLSYGWEWIFFWFKN